MPTFRMPALAISLAMTAAPALLAAQPASSGAPSGSTSPVVSARPVTTNADSSWTQAPESPAVTSAAPAQAPAPAAPAPAPAPAPIVADAGQATPPASPVAAAPAEPRRDTVDEPPTLFNGRSVKVGGYGGIGVQYARIHGEDGVLTGAEGALLLDHRFAVGVAGYSWASQQRVAAAGNFLHPYLHYGYGGLLVRYHIYIPNFPVYFSAAALIGGGAIGLTNAWNGDIYRENSDIFFVCEPQVGLHVNFTRWMRAGLDAGYRVHSGVGKFGYTESDFNGLSLGGNIQFGWL